jgi:hypothetical protein
MKFIFKVLAELLGTFLVINFVSVGVMVIALSVGVQAGIWLLWYLVLFSTLAALLASFAAAIVFLVEFGHDKYHWFASTLGDVRGHHKTAGKMAFHG